jgi:TonB family protein
MKTMAERVRRQAFPVPVAVAFSAALHLTIVAAGAAVVRLELASRHQPPDLAQLTAYVPGQPIEVEPPLFAAARMDLPGPPRPDLSEPPEQGGRKALPRPDTSRQGRGGTDTSSSPALNLADRDDRIRLTPEMQSRIDRDQLHRLATALVRESLEDGRYTTNPMELTFLASGHGQRLERRPPAETDPSRGALQSAPPASRGRLRIGAAWVPEGLGLDSPPPGHNPGSTVGSPGLGVRSAAPGQDHRASAAVASARPMVRQGAPSVPANDPGKPKDTVDATQEVASPVQSILHASTAGGKPGEGPGGQDGPGATGSGGQTGPGSRAEVMGNGGGGSYVPNPREAALTNYQRRMAAKLYPLWENAFPRWAILAQRQGTVIISFTVLANGSVQSPFVKRPSGIAEFDSRCLAAVRAASPFEPLPANLGVRRMQWEMSFEASNPIVR